MLKAILYRLADVPGPYWDFVHQYGTIYQSKPYADCLASSGFAPFVVAVYGDGRMVGGSVVTSGRRLLGFPVHTRMYFGPVVNELSRAGEVLSCTARILKGRSLTLTVIASPDQAQTLANHPDLLNWQRVQLEFMHWDISGEMDDFWKELPKGKRAAIKKARREGVVIKEMENEQEVDQFYGLHAMSMTRGGLEVGGRAYCRNLISMLKPQGLARGFLALHPKTRTPIAGVILLLGVDKVATYLQVGHDYEHRQLGSTDLLMWHCLEVLTANGYRVFDLVGMPQGDSPRAVGIRHFKAAWVGSKGVPRTSFAFIYGCSGVSPAVISRISAAATRVRNRLHRESDSRA